MKKNLLICLKLTLFIAFFVTIDQLTKHYAKMFLMEEYKKIPIIKNVLVLKYLDGGNTGAAWGIFSGKVPILILISLVVVTIVCFFIRNIERMIHSNYSLNNSTLIILKYLFALLIAGAFGNIIDRIYYGYVIDFICLDFIDFPIFNVADMYVSISCFLIVIICLFKLKEKDFNKIFSLRKNK